MKKIFLLICFIYIFFMQSNVLAYQNEKSGFDGFYWGQTIEEIRKNYEVKLISSKNNESIYTVNLLKSIYGQDVEDKKIIASFYKDKLYRIEISFINSKNNEVFLDLRKNLISDFGEPTNNRYDSYRNNTYYNMTNLDKIVGFNWEGKRTSIDVNKWGSNIKLTVIDRYMENQISEDIRFAQRMENVISAVVFIAVLVILSVIIMKLVKKIQKPIDKYFILITNGLFAIVLLDCFIDREELPIFIMFLITIYNIYGMSSNIKATFYICLYFIFNIVFLLIDTNLGYSNLAKGFRFILFGIEIVNVIISIFWFKKLLKTKYENRE